MVREIQERHRGPTNKRSFSTFLSVVWLFGILLLGRLLGFQVQANIDGRELPASRSGQHRPCLSVAVDHQQALLQEFTLECLRASLN